MKTYIHALDLSLNSSGIAIFNIDGGLIECSTIDTNSEKDTRKKLVMIANEFKKFINAYKPEKVIIEQGFSRFNISTQQVFRVHGLANFLYSDFEQIYIPAMTIKKIVGGAGNMKKEEIRNIVSKIYPKMRWNSLDESDACSIGLAYFYKEGILKHA